MQIFINWQNFPTATILIKAQLFTFRVILQADSRMLNLSLYVIFSFPSKNQSSKASKNSVKIGSGTELKHKNSFYTEFEPSVIKIIRLI